MAAKPTKQQIEQIRRASRESRTRLSKTAAAHRVTDTTPLDNNAIIGELSLLLLTIEHEIAYQKALAGVKVTAAAPGLTAANVQN